MPLILLDDWGSNIRIPVYNSRLGDLAIDQSPILNTTITVDWLVKRGHKPMSLWYQKAASHKAMPTLFLIV